MANEIYHKMAAALNSSFVEEEPIDNKRREKLVEEETPEETLPAVSQGTDVVPYEEPEEKGPVFEEQEYVKEVYHETIEDVSDVMDILKSDLRQGSRASLFEAYSNLAKTKLSAVDSLKSFDKDIKHEERFENADKEDTNQNQAQQNITLNLNGADMLDKILEYRDREVKPTDAEVIEEEDK